LGVWKRRLRVEDEACPPSAPEGLGRDTGQREAPANDPSEGSGPLAFVDDSPRWGPSLIRITISSLLWAASCAEHVPFTFSSRLSLMNPRPWREAIEHARAAWGAVVRSRMMQGPSRGRAVIAMGRGPRKNLRGASTAMPRNAAGPRAGAVRHHVRRARTRWAGRLCDQGRTCFPRPKARARAAGAVCPR